MTVRIDLKSAEGGARPQVLLDFVEQADDFPLKLREIYGAPFTAVYIGDERQYDVEIWIDGNLRHRVPPHSDRIEAIYEEIETAHCEDHTSAPRFDASACPGLEDLKREIAEHAGQIALLKWEGLRRSVEVHTRNTRELDELLEEIATSPDIAVEMFQNVRPPYGRQEIEAHVDQRLHNYVASSASLIEHTRNVLRSYEGSHLAKEYDTRKSVVVDSNAAAFLRKLRNYTLHYELPFIGNTVTFGPESTMTTEILLSTADLLKWDGWNASARSLLESGDTISLRDVVHDHTALISDLNNWVLNQFEALHRYDLFELERVRDEFNWVLSGGQLGRPRSTPFPRYFRVQEDV